jgi:peptidoglycan/LPS O-acetylase OafA/YrhL
VEEIFYLFFPLVCRSFRRGKSILVLLMVLVVLGPFARSHAFNHNPVWREYSYLGGMDAIALGCLTALLLMSRRLSRLLLWAAASVGTVLLVFCLCFSSLANRWDLGRSGLDMTILAVGSCLVIAAVAQTQWQAPRLFRPLLMLGQRSYEVYLTHMFVVFGLFYLFIRASKEMKMIPVLFVAVLLVSGFLGELMARGYSEPMNRWLRRRWGDGAKNLGSVIDSDNTNERSVSI